MKKVKSIFMILMLLFLFTISVNASTLASYKAVGPSEAVYKESITYDLIVDSGDNFSGNNYYLDYDSAELKYVSFSSNYGVTFDSNTKNLVFPEGGLNVTDGQKIGTIKFEVIEAFIGADVGFKGQSTITVREKEGNNTDVTDSDNKNTDEELNTTSQNNTDDMKFYFVVGCITLVAITLIITTGVIIAKNKKHNTI